MSDHHNGKAKEILSTIKYATIATVSDAGEPWNTPVTHVFDDKLNLYWVSDKESQHSGNIRANGLAMIVIVDPESKRGVYIEASAVELSDPAEILAMRRTSKGSDYAGSPDELLGPDIQRAYKATPAHIWMNDVETKGGVFIRHNRVEVGIDELREGVA